MRALMVQGTSSGAGKTTLVAALCRIFSDKGLRVAPFKSQNMSNYACKMPGFEVSQAQAVQAVAARCEIEPRLNPILLKPLGGDTSMVYVDGRPYRRMRARQYHEGFASSKGMEAASRALSSLQRDYDMVILEGAGSPAEINLQRHDIANMRVASKAKAPVLLVSDIDRGGSFASLYGTLSLIEPRYKKLVKGFVLNKFRGDPSILKPGFAKLRRLTGLPVLGTVPMVDVSLPGEDSLDGGAKAIKWNSGTVSKIDRELGRIAKIVESSLDIKAIAGMVR